MTDPYDLLAPLYRDYTRGRSVYLAAIDDYILGKLPPRATSVLDVGAGDGVRGMALSKRMGARRVVLAEPSKEMAALCRSHAGGEVWECSAEDLPERPGEFDVALCLWNVLGHVSSPSARAQALSRIAALLAPGGRLYLDVNNRHNAAAYGAWRVMQRRLVDWLQPDASRGDAAFDWKIGNRLVPAMGHLFTPAEMNLLWARVPLRLIERVSVDYATGAIDRSPYKGQLLFVLER